MDIKTIRGLSDQDIKAEQARASEQLFRVRFQQSLGNQEGVKGMRSLRFDIARLQTIARERALDAERKANPAPKATAPAPSQRTERKKARKA